MTTVQNVSRTMRDIALEVIDAACERRDERGVAPFEEVMQERWPSGPGGVGHAHARTRATIRALIREFYTPNDWSPEPTGAT
jgi:hypothetical protein